MKLTQALGETRTGDILHFRWNIYQLSYPGSSAGWVELHIQSNTTQCKVSQIRSTFLLYTNNQTKMFRNCRVQTRAVNMHQDRNYTCVTPLRKEVGRSYACYFWLWHCHTPFAAHDYVKPYMNNGNEEMAVNYIKVLLYHSCSFSCTGNVIQ